MSYKNPSPLVFKELHYIFWIVRIVGESTFLTTQRLQGILLKIDYNQDECKDCDSSYIKFSFWIQRLGKI